MLRLILFIWVIIFSHSGKLFTQCSFTVNAGPDLKVCMPGDMITINGKITGTPTEIFWTPPTGLSNPKSPVTKATVSGPMEYILTAKGLSSTNLIVNGNFEAGRTGFFTDYLVGSTPCYGAGYLDCEGTYDVINNPQLGHSGWAPCGDHTSGGGLMMVLNGAAAFQNVWCQNVNVVPDMDYVFTTWITSVHSSSPAILQFSINGTNIGPNFTSSGSTCTWEKYEVTWNSGSNTSAFICILNENTATGGNDFAIDDIGFRKVCEVKDTVKIDVEEILVNIENPDIVTCDQPTLKLDGSTSSSGTGWTYQWTSADGKILSGGNTKTPTIRGPGTYYFTVCSPLPNCCLTKSVEVRGNIIPPDLFLSVKDTLGCNNLTVTVSSRSNKFPLDYNWSGPGGFSSIDPFIVVTEAGKYVLTITDEYNCKTIDSVTVFEKSDNPKISISSNPINCFEDTARLKANSSVDNSKFEWIGPKKDTQRSDTWNVIDSGMYYLKVVSPAGCIKFDSVRIVLDKTVPDLVYIPDTITCINDSAIIRITTNQKLISYTWDTNHPFRILDSLSIKTNQPGQYSLRVISENGCQHTLFLHVTADLAKPIIKPKPDTYFLNCKNRDTLLISGVTDPNVRIQWKLPDGTITYLDSVNSNQEGIHTVIGTAKNGCIDSAKILIHVDTMIPRLLAGMDTITCKKPLTKLSIFEFPFINSNYTWTGPNGFTSMEQSPQIQVPGTYQVTVTAKNFCTNTSQVTIHEDKEKPFLQVLDDTLTCKKDSLILNANSDRTDAYYEWRGPNGFSSNQKNPFISEPGTYSFIVTNPNGCKDSAEITIYQDIGKPDLISFNDTLNCLKRIANLSAVSMRDSLSYLWTGPNGFTANLKSISVSQAGNYTIRVSTKDDCFSVATVEVVEDTLTPDLKLLPDTLNCLKTETNLDFISSSNLILYNWSGPGNFLSNQKNPLVSRGGNYNLIITAENNCTSIANINIPQDTMIPRINLNYDSINCIKREVDLIANVIPIHLNGEWTTPLQQKITSNSIKTREGGLFEFDVIGDNFCVNSGSVFIKVDTIAPEVYVKDDTINCYKPRAVLNVVSNMNNVVYEWMGPNNYTSTKAYNMIQDAGRYSVKVTALNGCSGFNNLLILVDTLKPEINTTSDSIHCKNPEAHLLAQSNIGNALFKWFDQNNQVLSTNAGYTSKTGGHFIAEVINPLNGCLARKLHFVPEDSLLITDVLLKAIHPKCGALFGSAQILSIVGGHNNIRYSIDQKRTYSGNPNFNSLLAGNYTLYVIDDKECEFEKDFQIIPIPFIDTDLIPEITLSLGDSSRLDLEIFPDRKLIQSIEWIPAIYLSCTDCEDPVVRPLTNTEYYVTVIDTNGCESTQRILVKVETPKVWVPNVFSPNGDNINDLVWIHGSKEEVTQINIFQIYDRWGNRVFENTLFQPNDQSKAWDGMFQNQKCNPGVYVYWAEVELIDGQKWIIRGDLTLIR